MVRVSGRDRVRVRVIVRVRVRVSGRGRVIYRVSRRVIDRVRVGSMLRRGPEGDQGQPGPH